MAVKKSQPKAEMKATAAASSTLETPASPWKWVYVGGALVATVTGALNFSHPVLSYALLLVGLLVGFLYFDAADVTNFGLRYLIVVAVAAYPSSYLNAAGSVGMYVGGFLNGFVNFLWPVLLAQILAAFWKKYFGA